MNLRKPTLEFERTRCNTDYIEGHISLTQCSDFPSFDILQTFAPYSADHKTWAFKLLGQATQVRWSDRCRTVLPGQWAGKLLSGTSQPISGTTVLYLLTFLIVYINRENWIHMYFLMYEPVRKTSMSWSSSYIARSDFTKYAFQSNSEGWEVLWQIEPIQPMNHQRCTVGLYAHIPDHPGLKKIANLHRRIQRYRHEVGVENKKPHMSTCLSIQERWTKTRCLHHCDSVNWEQSANVTYAPYVTHMST